MKRQTPGQALSSSIPLLLIIEPNGEAYHLGARSKEQGARSKEQGAKSKEQGATDSESSSLFSLLAPRFSLLLPYSKYPVTSTMNCTVPEGCEQSTRKSPAAPSRRIVLFARVCPDR